MSSKNLFDLLQDDEDEKTVKTTTKAAPAATGTTATKKVTDTKKSDNKDKSPKMTGQKPPRKINTSTTGDAVTDDSRPSTKRDSKAHVRQPRTDASGNIRNRQFDRKSGTGRPHNENKKGGAGQGNWGKEGSIEEATATATTATTTEEKEEATTTATTAPAVEDKTITLTEHLKQLQSQSVALDAPKIRVAGEGESTNQWDDFEPLVKVNPVNKKDNKSTKEEKKTKKNFIQVELKSGSSKPQRRGPNNKNKAQAPQVDDTKTFPALSKA